jgi:4-amino-4-deoxy-L-arabinose transferase-like glycosyltransferase
MVFKFIKHYGHHLGLLILIYFVIFLKIDGFHMRWWDESMFAVNTFEMMQNGKYFSLYYDGMPDLFNTKPPLTSWLQIFFVKIFGYNELGLRMHSAIASSLSVLMVFNFLSKKYNIYWAWISALILLSSFGFIHFHTSRTGDSDAILSFFLLAANVSFFNFLLLGKHKYVFIMLLMLSLAFATKLYAALLFLPAYFIILIWQKKLRSFVLNYYFLFGLVLFCLSIFGLFYLRELDTPGYLHQILFKDAGRLFTIVENHHEPLYFYIEKLFFTRFSQWFVLLMLGIVITFLLPVSKERTMLAFFLILVLVYVSIISISITKLEWYDMPLYPYISAIAGYPLFIMIKQFSFYKLKLSAMQMTSFIAIIFIYPYYQMFDKSQGNTIQNGEKALEGNERYIFVRSNDKKNLNGIKVYYDEWKGALLYYKYKLSLSHQRIELSNAGNFDLDDLVLVCSDSLKQQLQLRYEFDLLDKYQNAQLIKIKKVF